MHAVAAPPMAAPAPGALTACHHCATVTANADAFCCAGCRVAYALIADGGLDDFYRQRVAHGPASPPVLGPDDGSWCDSEAFARAHVRALPGGLALVQWHVDGLTCSACVWLLERLPRLQRGVRACRVDLGAERIDIAYDPVQCQPSEHVALAGRLGYRLRAVVDGDAAETRQAARRDLALRFAVAAGSATASMHLALNLVAGELTGDLGIETAAMFRWLALAAATPACLWSAWPLHRSAFAALRGGAIGADAAASLVVLLALTSGVVAALARSGSQYADAAAMFVALLLGGRLAYAVVKDRALGRAGALEGVIPASAHRLSGVEDRDGTLVATADLVVGDLVGVGQDERIPADGAICADAGFVDASTITGESEPCAVRAGDAVWAGTVCRSPWLVLRVDAVGGGTRVGGLLAAARVLAPTAPGFAERMQAAFLPALLLLVGITGICWHLIDPTRALDQMVAMALVACPCAVGLAMPLVLAIATVRAGDRGLVLRDAAALERLAGATDIAFDKTGTLTSGEPRVVAWCCHDREIAPWILAAEQRSRHPAAIAIVRHLRGLGIAAADLADAPWCEEPGRGVICATPFGELRIGSAALTGSDEPAATIAGTIVATWTLADALKVGAADLVAALSARGVRVHLLSGDGAGAVAAAGSALGIDPRRTRSGCSPEDKARYIDHLRGAGAVVAMIGDGVNDAAALSRADVGIGVRGGLAAALPACSVYVLRDDIQALSELFTAAGLVRSTIRRCLAIGLFYNVLGVAGVVAGAIGPLLCAVLMPAGSLSVLLVALRARLFIAPAPAAEPG